MTPWDQNGETDALSSPMEEIPEEELISLPPLPTDRPAHVPPPLPNQRHRDPRDNPAFDTEFEQDFVSAMQGGRTRPLWRNWMIFPLAAVVVGIGVLVWVTLPESRPAPRPRKPKPVVVTNPPPVIKKVKTVEEQIAEASRALDSHSSRQLDKALDTFEELGSKARPAVPALLTFISREQFSPQRQDRAVALLVGRVPGLGSASVSPGRRIGFDREHGTLLRQLLMKRGMSDGTRRRLIVCLSALPDRETLWLLCFEQISRSDDEVSLLLIEDIARARGLRSVEKYRKRIGGLIKTLPGEKINSCHRRALSSLGATKSQLDLLDRLAQQSQARKTDTTDIRTEPLEALVRKFLLSPSSIKRRAASREIHRRKPSSDSLTAVLAKEDLYAGKGVSPIGLISRLCERDAATVWMAYLQGRKGLSVTRFWQAAESLANQMPDSPEVVSLIVDRFLDVKAPSTGMLLRRPQLEWPKALRERIARRLLDEHNLKPHSAHWNAMVRFLWFLRTTDPRVESLGQQAVDTAKTRNGSSIHSDMEYYGYCLLAQFDAETTIPAELLKIPSVGNAGVAAMRFYGDGLIVLAGQPAFADALVPVALELMGNRHSGNIQRLGINVLFMMGTRARAALPRVLAFLDAATSSTQYQMTVGPAVTMLLHIVPPAEGMPIVLRYIREHPTKRSARPQPNDLAAEALSRLPSNMLKPFGEDLLETYRSPKLTSRSRSFLGRAIRKIGLALPEVPKASVP